MCSAAPVGAVVVVADCGAECGDKDEAVTAVVVVVLATAEERT